MKIRHIAVVGAGTMGTGIARVSAAAGFDVMLVDRNLERAEAGFAVLRKGLERQADKGNLTPDEKKAIMARLGLGRELKDCLKSDLIIEAAAEIEEVKKEIFQALDAVCPSRTIFASNTSSISINRLAAASGRPDRFIGMHFMNPAHVMKLVEVIVGLQTASETVEAVVDVSKKLGKTPVVVNDSPGFVANRILMPMINDAIFCLQEGVADRESIDAIARMGAHHPMGPLELADFIGLDVCLDILNILHAELGEKYRPCTLLRNMVAAGSLGRKTGAGFYEYR